MAEVNPNLVLYWPENFMNLIGKNVKLAQNRYKVSPIKNLIILHDCLETKPGIAKIVAPGISVRGHNGLKSISDNFGGSKEFTRIAIGIGRPEERDPEIVANYVLANFIDTEM